MPSPLSRRDALKTLGVAGAVALQAPLPPGPGTGDRPAAPILPLVSSSDVFVPPRGRSFVKYSFDFPEPSVAFEGLTFGLMVFTRENAYGLDQARMTVRETDTGLELRATGLVWAGGQQRADGEVLLALRRVPDGVEWDGTVTMDQPIKAVTTVLRGVPRGPVAGGGGAFTDPGDDELLYGYPFGGGDLFVAGGMNTPLLQVREADGRCFFVSSRDTAVRTKRFYLQPGERGYRLEAVHEVEGWKDERRVSLPAWRAGHAATQEAATADHYAHLARAYRIPDWDTRPDVPDWLRRTALVTTLHGMHYTGYIFNDYPKMLTTLRWMAARIPGERILAFLSAWDGRYYWNYPAYELDPRMGGARAFRRLIDEGHDLGVRFMPMFGANAANRRQSAFPALAEAATAKVDGDTMDLNWVDWDNDRHMDGWLAYMNLGVASWREWLGGRIGEMIERFGVDAYFLDIAGGWINNPRADMHAGLRQLVHDLRARHPGVAAVGEMHYDALLEVLPLFQAGGGGPAGPFVQRHARFFQHLSHPAPGRGSTGVHEEGFSRFDPDTLSLAPHATPTLNVVDDTLARHQDLMDAVIRRARERAGL
ncbi:MAG: twin-arginine translocation signal domain-containing protein [Gemmatimonadetes bacterium]|nr:twin-arginine translocation signal domain-containing protein [Gemmatimonadota bacterium]